MAQIFLGVISKYFPYLPFWTHCTRQINSNWAIQLTFYVLYKRRCRYCRSMLKSSGHQSGHRVKRNIVGIDPSILFLWRIMRMRWSSISLKGPLNIVRVEASHTYLQDHNFMFTLRGPKCKAIWCHRIEQWKWKHICFWVFDEGYLRDRKTDRHHS